MASVVIAAHNEEVVIAGTLRAIVAGADSAEFDVVVVANGCRDETAAVASSFPGVNVIDIPTAGKAHALNVGDAAATGFPRIYVDADVALTTNDARRLVHAMAAPGRVTPLAATVRRRMALERSPWMVRAYYAINMRLPTFEHSLFGRGVVALTENGRARFDQFPEQVADDLFLDSLFAPEEKLVVGDVTVTIMAPRSTRDLVRRLTRVRRGNAELRRASGTTGVPGNVRRPDRWAWFRAVSWKQPRLTPAAVCYVAITVIAAVRARYGRASGWERDESTRRPVSRTSTTSAPLA